MQRVFFVQRFPSSILDTLAGNPSKKSKRPWVAPRVKVLTEEDVGEHTIFDVLMPLPGKDVAYPGGFLGERYREFLRMDGLDPDSLSSKHKYAFYIPCHVSHTD